MLKVKTDERGRLILPDTFLQRRHISPNIEYWLDEREGGLVLHPCLPDARKLYVQPTTRCNLHCRTCIRMVSNVLPYSEEMRNEILYGYEPRSPFSAGGWPVKADAWVMWGTLELPRLHWGAERRCRFVQDRAVVVGWDGNVSPCYALSHNYTYFAIDGRKKRVNRYILGNVNEHPLAETWMSEEYVRFRSEVREFHFPSCPDCDLRETCDLRERNEGCWGLNPSCADCLWAQDIVRCP